MKFRSLATAAASLALVGSIAVAAPAEATEVDGPTLTDLLEAQGGGTDRNWYDFDILAAGVEVAGLSDALDDPAADLTVFLPNDRAFQALVADLFGWRYWFAGEAKILDKVASLGAETLATVILYHAVPGRIDAETALSVPRGTALTTLQGGDIRVYPKRRLGTAVLADQDRNDINPFLVRSKLDIEASNGIAHGISFVLRPIDL
ncbi:MAG: fasciclin domain-containing protein [Ilumatobacteraceae bacterium]|nr:fasciclin domain-containing protein [Ilumatobacteraceae bacterium]